MNIGFDVRDSRTTHSVAALANVVPAKPEGLPAEYDFDIPPILRDYVWPAYPRDLLTHGIKGEASVRYVIDERGLVESTEVISATTPEFGAALRAALQRWVFLPPQRKGRSTRTQLVQTEKFLAAGFVRPKDEIRAAKQLRAGGKAFVNVAALDHPLQRIFQLKPQYPLELQCAGKAGSATVEFIVSKDGHALLPRMISATSPEVGWAAVTEVAYWYFQPPRVKGKPVDVQTTAEIKFPPA